MNSTTYEVIGVATVTLMSLIGKCVEHSRQFHSARARANLVACYYECFNFHLHLSLGMLGLAWSQRWDTAFCCPLIVLIMLGVTIKGVFAAKPGTLRFLDRNAFFGLYCPNMLAVVCVLWVLFGKQVLYDGVQTESPRGREAVSPARPTPTPTQSNETAQPEIPQ